METNGQGNNMKPTKQKNNKKDKITDKTANLKWIPPVHIEWRDNIKDPNNPIVEIDFTVYSK